MTTPTKKAAPKKRATKKAAAVASPAPTRPTRDEDHALTLKVVRTILNAQIRGTLSADIHLRRLPTQIVLENTTEADREWLTKKYKGATESKGWLWREKGSSKKVSKAFEEGVYTAPLRAQFDNHDRFVPRLEIWGVKVPHVHHSPKGSVVRGNPVWRCGAYGCNAVMKKGDL